MKSKSVAAPLSRSAPDALRLAPVQWAIVLSVLFVGGSFLPAGTVFELPEHYLALHTALEVFSITVSAMVFALGWNLRRTPHGGPFVWLGAVFLAVALTDFFHALSYDGMPVFVTSSGPEKAVEFWLAARVFAATGLFVLAFLPNTRWSAARARLVLLAALGVTALVAWLVLFHQATLPRTFIPGEGITPLKIVIEYLLATTYALSALLLFRRGIREGSPALAWLASAAWAMALAELYFTLYVEVSDLFNVLGHVYKFVASVMIYKAVFRAGVREPHEALAHERAMLRAMIDSVPDLIAFKDTRGAYLGCNKAFGRCYDIREEDLLGRTDADLFGPGMLAAYDCSGVPVVSMLERHEEWVEGPDGSMRLLDTLRIPFRGESGELLGEIGISRDFTERRRVREQIAEREQRLMMALQGASLSVWDWDIPTGRMLFSPLWASMLGRRLQDLAPDISTLEALVHPDDWGDIQAALEPHLRGETESYTAEYRLRHSDGHWVWVQDAGRVLERDAEGKPVRAVGLHQDISSRKLMEESLLQLATSDPLTGLWNRRHFTEMVNGELGRVRRHGSVAALLLLDLDHFKRINDTRGHAAGDEVLRHFSGLVSRHLREVDVFARLGGEEFGVLLPCVDDAAGALRAADRIRDLVAASPALIGTEPLAFSVSIGVAMLGPDDTGFDVVFSRADEALYEAKRSGRNRAVLAKIEAAALV